MTELPVWLPEPINYASYGGDWSRFLADVYVKFRGDFVETRPTFRGRPVVHDSWLSEGKEEAFWHVISEADPETGGRVPDLRRCERVPWIRAIIENTRAQQVSVWRNKRRRGTRTLLWLEALDFLVVLAERRRVVVLITAYCTDHAHTRQKLAKERDVYRRKQAPP